jgi:hypothetical protein
MKRGAFLSVLIVLMVMCGMSWGQMPPVITSILPDTTDVVIDEGERVVFEVKALDPEGDLLTYRWLVR